MTFKIMLQTYVTELQARVLLPNYPAIHRNMATVSIGDVENYQRVKTLNTGWPLPSTTKFQVNSLTLCCTFQKLLQLPKSCITVLAMHDLDNCNVYIHTKIISAKKNIHTHTHTSINYQWKKLKTAFSLKCLYAIQRGNKLGLFYSHQDLHSAPTEEMINKRINWIK